MTMLTESEVEQAALDWLESLSWSVAHGPDIAPGVPDAERTDYGEVLLARRLRDALARLNPDLPRDGDLLPTIKKSEKKTRTLIERITGQSSDPSLFGISLGALIENAEDALQGKERQEQDAQRAELEEVRDRLCRLRDICQTQEDADTRQSTLEAAQERLDALLDGTSLDGLRERVDTKRQATDTLVLKRQLAVNSNRSAALVLRPTVPRVPLSSRSNP